MNFFDKLLNAWNIFKLSLSFIGRDKSLLIVPLLTVLSSAIFIAAFFLFFFMPYGIVLVTIATLLGFFLFVGLWSTFLGSVQSWMVYEVAQGKDTTFFSGLGRAIKNLPDIIAFTVVIFLIQLFVNSLKQKGGPVGQAAGSFVSTVTGIAGKLVLPAMIVTERNFVEAVKQLGKAVKAIPEIAAFEIGIVPLKSVVSTISFLISIAVGVLFGWLTGVILFFFLALAIMILNMLINQIYYTLLYLALIEKKKVPGLKIK